MGRRILVSVGEFLDRLSILEIKVEHLTDRALLNVQEELAQLVMLDTEDYRLTQDFADLKQINQMLWDVEDQLRACERKQCFDSQFIELARQVYKLNDQRHLIKRAISNKYMSSIVEEKSYA